MSGDREAGPERRKGGSMEGMEGMEGMASMESREGSAGDGWGTAAIWVLLGLMILGTVATIHSVWHTFLR